MVAVKNQKLFVVQLYTKEKKANGVKTLRYLSTRTMPLSDLNPLTSLEWITPNEFSQPSIENFSAVIDPGTLGNVTYDSLNRVASVVNTASVVPASVTQSVAGEKPIISDNGMVENLLTYSEQFDNAIWLKQQCTITANSTTAPDGTNTADSLLETAVTNVHRIIMNSVNYVPSEYYTFSVYAKPLNGRNWLNLFFFDGAGAFFDVANGAVGTVNANYTASIEPANNGFFRCSVTRKMDASLHLDAYIGTASANGTANYLGDITKGLYIWGAQIRKSETQSDYWPVTDTPKLAGVGKVAPENNSGSVNRALTFALAQTQSMTFGVCPYNMRAQGDYCVMMAIKPAYSQPGGGTNYEILNCETLNVGGWIISLNPHASDGTFRINWRTSQAGAYTDLLTSYQMIAQRELVSLIFNKVGATGYIYMNGSLIASGPLSDAALTTNELKLGGSSLQKFSGQIAYLAYKPSSLAAADLQSWKDFFTYRFFGAYTPYTKFSNYAPFKQILDPNNYTFSDNPFLRISKANDVSQNVNFGSQSTDNNKPLLTRFDTKENRILYSEDLSQSVWVATSATKNTRTLFTVTGASGKVLQLLNVVPGKQYILSLKARAVSGNTAVCLQHAGATSTSTNITLTATLQTFSTTVTAGAGTTIDFGIRDYNAAGFGQIEMTEIQVREASGTSSSYVGTIAFPWIAGVGNSRALAFNGTTQTLLSSLAVNPTGGIYGAVVLTPALQHLGVIYGAYGGTSRFELYINAAGSIQIYMFLDGSNYIGRTSPNGSYVAGETFVLTFDYNGGTAATGLRIFKNGVQIDNASVSAGTYTVPGAGQTLTLGSRNAGASLFYNGKISFAEFAQGAIWSDTDRKFWENYLANRFINPVLTNPNFGVLDTPIYGILRGISGLGQSMGEVVADDKYGSIEIDVTRGTIEHDKRFYDLFEKETVLNQDILIYSVQRQEDYTDTFADWQIEFSGQVASAKISPDRKTMTLDIRSKEISYDSPNYLLSRANFPAASNDASGKFLPIAFGVCELVPVFFRTQDTAQAGGIYKVREADFALASNFYNADPDKSFINGSVLNRYCLNDENNYSLLTLPYSATCLYTELIVFPGPTGTYIAQANLPEANELNKLTPSNNYIVTMGEYSVIPFISGSTSIPSKPTFNLDFFEKTKGGQVPNGPSVGGGNTTYNTANISTFPALVAGFPFASAPRVAINLSKPVFLWKESGYMIGASFSDGSFPVGTAYWGRKLVTGSEVPAYLQDQQPWRLYYFTRTSAFERFIYAVGRIGTSDLVSPYTYERLGHAIKIVEDANLSPLALVGTQDPVDISTLKLVYQMEGLKTQSTFLTGTSGQLITRADHIIKLLYYLSNNFSLTGLDTTTFSPGNYAPDLGGVTEGKESFRDIVLEVLENSACKLVPRRGTNSVALWAYGVQQPTAAIITEADATLEDIELNGLDAIVNRIRVNFDKSAIPLSTAAQQQGQENYRQTYEASNALSIELYGVKDLDSDFIKLKYARLLSAVQRWADYKLAQYAPERMYVTFRLPFWKNNYRLLELMDIIEFNHIDNVSYYGSASSNTEPPVTTPLNQVPNIFSFESEFDNAYWTKTEATITANAIVAPDTTISADKLVESVNNSTHRIIRSVTVTSGATYTYSIYAKAAERNKIFLEAISGVTDVYAYIDLVSGLKTSGNADVEIKRINDGWFKISVTFIAKSTSASLYCFLSTVDSGSITYTGNGTSGVYIWKAEMKKTELDFNLGDLWRRAKSYKMRILSRNPNFNINSEETTISFRCLVLDNPTEIF